MGIYKAALQNISAELLEPFCRLWQMNSAVPDTIVFLFNLDGDETGRIREILQRTQRFMNDHFKKSVSFGVGSLVSEPEDISLSHSEARRALDERLVCGMNAIVFSKELEPLENRRLRYPFELENKLSAVFKAGEIENTQKQVRAFFDAVCAYPYSRIQLALLRFYEYIMRLCEENQPDAAEDLVPIQELFDYSIKDIEDYLCELCAKTLGNTVQMNTLYNDKNRLIKQVMEIVQDNLYNTNFSVKYIADKVNLSVNYLRTLFKNIEKESLYDYITRKKLDLICSLLTGTSLSVQEISNRLGFTSKNYFFTYFKKQTGMTPSQYRKEYGISGSKLL
jgi:AraC-like DNA-binding protein